MIKGNGRISMTADQAATRAVDVAGAVANGLAAYYKLGTGGRKPGASMPYNEGSRCDCSGFVAWACGYDRFQGYHGSRERWVNTDAILYSAYPSAVEGGFKSLAALDNPDSQASGMFRKVAKTEAVMPGDLLVYGSTKVSGVRVPGHVGIIVNVQDDFVRGGYKWYRNLDVAHCSPSNLRRFGSGYAIAVTDAAIWRNKGYIVRPTFYAG